MTGGKPAQAENGALWTNAPLLRVISIPVLMAGVIILIAVSTRAVGLAGLAVGGSAHRPAAIYAFATVCIFLSL